MYVVFSVLYAVDAMEEIASEEFINFRAVELGEGEDWRVWM
jgi:hypothetical protein